jgi:hypothetical protein
MGTASNGRGLRSILKAISASRQPDEAFMEPTSSIALRAHVVLLSASVAVLTVACLCIVLLLHVPLGDSGTFELRAAVFGMAVLGMLYVRHKASHAFRAALQDHRISLSDVNANGVSIADECPHAWLVQMYAELCPAAARRQIMSR